MNNRPIADYLELIYALRFVQSDEDHRRILNKSCDTLKDFIQAEMKYNDNALYNLFKILNESNTQFVLGVIGNDLINMIDSGNKLTQTLWLLTGQKNIEYVFDLLKPRIPELIVTHAQFVNYVRCFQFDQKMEAMRVLKTRLPKLVMGKDEINDIISLLNPLDIIRFTEWLMSEDKVKLSSSPTWVFAAQPARGIQETEGQENVMSAHPN